MLLGVRSSDRLRSQTNADETVMGRDMPLAQRRDLPLGTLLSPTLPMLTFSDEQIIDRASRLTVLLGSSHKEKLLSSKFIKYAE